ncbi:MAG: TldD/PmbA family protein [Bacteroidales bacterium]|nr:TldD/PmbA family protein [Bacteroidales bacterium]
MITDKELSFVREALESARDAGAQQARATLSVSEEDLVATLDGEVDRVTHCADRSLALALFVDGRFGSYSTNKLDPASLQGFIRQAVAATRMVAEDPCRALPDPARCCHDAISGDELGLVDSARGQLTPAARQQIALEASVMGSTQHGTSLPVATQPRGESQESDNFAGSQNSPISSDPTTDVVPPLPSRGRQAPAGAALQPATAPSGEAEYQIVSEEGEYSDSVYDTVVMDTNGLCCRHSESSFDYGVEITVESDGQKYSGYWWDASSRLAGLDAAGCGRRALARAVSQIGSAPAPTGKYTAVIDAEIASKMVSPLLRALSGYSIQQNNSFLMDSLGKQLFPEGLTIMDLPRIPGQTCSKFFDSEGVATRKAPIIEHGLVREYFINTYMANKMQLAPTIEDATRPKVLPWPEAGLDRDAILRRCGSGILVTGFNGGNSNPVTGDFSYGIEGYLFEDGRVVRPVSEMLMTGNFLSLWARLLAAGDDARPCQTKLVPTLAFAEVDFSG